MVKGGKDMSIKIVPPNDIQKINKQIRALKSMIPLDTYKDKQIHMEALKEYKKRLEVN